MKKLLYFIPLFLGILACGIQSLPTQDISNTVNATLTAIAHSNLSAATPLAALTEEASVQVQPAATQTGTVTGTLTFPASVLPPMRVTFFSLDGSYPSYTDTTLGQSSFSIELPAGTYYVVAYALPAEGFSGNLAGGYTNAIACGLTADCTDHSLIPSTVIVNQNIVVNPADWYAPEGAFPSMPTP